MPFGPVLPKKFLLPSVKRPVIISQPILKQRVLTPAGGVVVVGGRGGAVGGLVGGVSAIDAGVNNDLLDVAVVGGGVRAGGVVRGGVVGGGVVGGDAIDGVVGGSFVGGGVVGGDAIDGVVGGSFVGGGVVGGGAVGGGINGRPVLVQARGLNSGLDAEVVGIRNGQLLVRLSRDQPDITVVRRVVQPVGAGGGVGAGGSWRYVLTSDTDSS